MGNQIAYKCDDRYFKVVGGREFLFYNCLLRFVSPLRLLENNAKGKAPRQLQWKWNLINLESKSVSVTYIDSISHCGLRLVVGALVLTLCERVGGRGGERREGGERGRGERERS